MDTSRIAARARRHITYANVVATLALCLALSGTAWAAITGAGIRNGTITGADIKTNSVPGGDVTNGTITGSDVRAGSIGAAQLAPDSAGASEVAASAIGASEVADNAIGSSEHLLNGVEDEIVDGTVDEEDLGNEVVDGQHLASWGITERAIGFWPSARLSGRGNFIFGLSTDSTTTVPLSIERNFGMTIQGNSVEIQTGGVYAVSAGFEWPASATGGSRMLALHLTPAFGSPDTVAADERANVSDAVRQTRQTVSTIMALNQGDVVQLKVNQNSGGTLNITSDPSARTFLALQWIAPLAN